MVKALDTGPRGWWEVIRVGVQESYMAWFTLDKVTLAAQ